MGIGGPSSPFPVNVDTFIVPLPLPIRPRIGPDLTELECSFSKVDERGYIADGHQMFAAAYEASLGIGTMTGALISNAYSAKVPAALPLILKAFAGYFALKWAYERQVPPLPLPGNPGFSAPFSRDTIEHLDGSARFRGYCAGLRPITPALVATIDVGFGPVWATEPPPE